MSMPVRITLLSVLLCLSSLAGLSQPSVPYAATVSQPSVPYAATVSQP